MDFHFRNGELFASRVQISRLARNINKQLRPDASHDECLDLASRLLGSELPPPAQACDRPRHPRLVPQ